MRDIAKNIRTLRTSKNMTQDELAEKLFVTRQTVSNYETGKSRPDVEMLTRIAEILDTDINSLIYGPQPSVQHSDLKSLIIGAALALVAWVLFLILAPIVVEAKGRTYDLGPTLFLHLCLRPLACLISGWTLAHLIGMALKKKPFRGNVARWICIALLVIILIWLLLVLWTSGATILNDWLFRNYIRGEWEYIEGINVESPGWRKLPPPIPVWLQWVTNHVFITLHSYWPYLLGLSGCCLWVTGFPLKKV